jgi:protein-S-isoprenylcysteine O-methyltransferase Ste14
MLWVRALFFTVLMPGTALVLFPSWIVRGQPRPGVAVTEPPRLLGLLLIAAGLVPLLASIRDFAVSGRGTLAPIDPPRKLVRVGLYRHVRNPMYVGVVTALLGEALFFQSRALATYAVVVWLVFHSFVVLYEEPHLRHAFGPDYDDYRSAVPRWIPRLRPANLSGARSS